MKKFLLGILLLSSLTGCKKILSDFIEKKVNNVIGEMSFTVDNKKYSDITAASLNYKGKLKAEAVADIGLNAKTMSIRVDEDVEKGKTYTQTNPNAQISWQNLANKDGNYSSAITGGSCTITIEEKTTKSIIGTFSGKLINESDKTKSIEIKNGSFNVRLLVD